MEKEQAAQKRKWDGWAKWLLIANLIWGGFKVLGATPEELIMLLPLLISLWAIYKFKRWGFYGFVGIRLASLFLCLGMLAYATGAEAYGLAQVIFSGVLGLVLVSLIVRTRWTDMDPVKFPFRGTSAPQGE